MLILWFVFKNNKDDIIDDSDYYPYYDVKNDGFFDLYKGKNNNWYVMEPISGKHENTFIFLHDASGNSLESLH